MNQTVSPTWKKELSDVLVRLGLAAQTFTGKLTINVNSGAVCDLERAERVK